MKHNKKAQIKHMFTFIIAILVVGAIALIGTKSVGNLLQDKCNVDLITFKNDMEAAIANNNGYGAVVQESFPAPCKYTLMCLVNTEAIVAQKETLVYADKEATPASAQFIIEQSVVDGTPKNIFLIDNDEINDVGYAPNLRLESTDVMCIPVSAGRFSMVMRGQGRTTLIQTD